MENKNFTKDLTINEAARLLGVSAQTLRRWDQSGQLKGHRRQEGGFRFYQERDLEQFITEHQLSIEKIAKGWVRDSHAWTPLSMFYCPESNLFQLRLQALESRLLHTQGIEEKFPLLTAVSGEIGNNSFDHNLGNWPDVRGIFFGFDSKRRKIVLADRGQGILKTISRVRSSISSASQALHVAFSEVLTGRLHEHRGNGLKFVRKIVTENFFSLYFLTGDAELTLKQGDVQLNILHNPASVTGCFAVLSF